jgi:hypothetical protein
MAKNLSLQRTGRVWIGLTAIAILILVAVIFSAAQRDLRMSSGAAASGASQFLAAAPGTTMKVVVEIQKQNGCGIFAARLLDKRSDTVYSRSTTPVIVRSDNATRFVMGKAADVRAAAVVHVTGTVDADHRLNAEQMVILTGYVEVY